ncbi:hypothetical protein BB542_23750 [Escherichia coli]|uniref:hypothetical protein n=1 Tax=Escherichia coli TaxID=562 RepID=UPI000BB7BA6D|nr:hypothetical protein [Escherichia coli]EAN2687259.1 hypothetical protein [Salmonella enterica]EIX9709529.1 hypothetical protein [Klebsiella pneumoniae]MGW43779.1 hypothetical protein [Salmonella enterica subsp. enterica serovar Anatum]PBU46708.1 hypothetical protein BB541_24135 [Escherichia coli]PBU51353.1 hypothetical protein BB542_23750 [Escherichia coli]
MINKITSTATNITLSKAFRLATFVLFEMPLILLLFGNIHNVPFFNFFMNRAYSGAFTDTGNNFYTPTNLINDFHSGSMHFYLIIPVLIVVKIIHLMNKREEKKGRV